MTATLDGPTAVPADAPPARHVLTILDRTGDTTIEWTTGNTAEERAAREHFDKLRGQGYLAYRVEGADRGDLLREFDPEAGEIIMSPQIVGG